MDVGIGRLDELPDKPIRGHSRPRGHVIRWDRVDNRTLVVEGSGCLPAANWAIVEFRRYPEDAPAAEFEPKSLYLARLRLSDDGSWRAQVPTASRKPGLYSLWAMCETPTSLESPVEEDVAIVDDL